MSSIDKYFSITSADKGVDTVGIAQPSGAINGITGAYTKTGRSDWQSKLVIRVDDVSRLKAGQPIRLSNLGKYGIYIHSNQHRSLDTGWRRRVLGCICSNGG